MFVAFVIYPFGYALWMASKPSLYADLISDRSYLPTVVNTLLFVGLGVNVKMFLALLLSGFFMRRRRWIRALLAVYILPWALAAAQACVSFHWMLIGEQGLVDGVLSALFGIVARSGMSAWAVSALNCSVSPPRVVVKSKSRSSNT